MIDRQLFILSLQNQLIQGLLRYGNLKDAHTNEKATTTLVNLFIDMQRMLHTQCFIEIGAYDVDFCRRAGSKYTEGKFLAIEANPFTYLQFSPEVTSLNPDINYIFGASTDFDGKIQIRIPEEYNGRNCLKFNKMSSLYRSSRASRELTVEVPAMRLETIVEKYGVKNFPACLWIDVEGAQLDVLKGAGTYLNNVTSIYIEIDTDGNFASDSTEYNIYDFLLEHSFMPVLRDYYWASQYNLLAVRADLLKEIQGLISRFFVQCVSMFRP